MISIDTAINTSCLMLQWPFTKKIYNKLCGQIKCCNGDKRSQLIMNVHSNGESENGEKQNEKK